MLNLVALLSDVVGRQEIYLLAFPPDPGHSYPLIILESALTMVLPTQALVFLPGNLALNIRRMILDRKGLILPIHLSFATYENFVATKRVRNTFAMLDRKSFDGWRYT